MDIFKRIYDITKANIQYHLDIDIDPFSSPKEEPPADYEYHQGQQSSSSSSPPPPPRQEDEITKAYAALEIPHGSDMDAVKKARRALLRKYHPDRHSTNKEKAELAEQISRELNNAYDVLDKYHKNKK